MPCALCDAPLGNDAIRVSGVDLCGPCAVTDPSDALQRKGFAVAWNVVLMRFHAGVGIPGLAEGFHLSCKAERWHHKATKLVLSEIEVGDPIFDDTVFVKASDEARARKVLAHEGVQSALVALLSDTRPGEIAGNHVTLDGPSLTVGVRPLAPLDEALVLQSKLETAVLALHLQRLG